MGSPLACKREGGLSPISHARLQRPSSAHDELTPVRFFSSFFFFFFFFFADHPTLLFASLPRVASRHSSPLAMRHPSSRVAHCHAPLLAMRRTSPHIALVTRRALPCVAPRHVVPSPRIAPVTSRHAFTTRCAFVTRRAFATHCPCRVASRLRHALRLRHASPRRDARFNPGVEMEESVRGWVGRVECKQVQASAGSLVVNYLDSRLSCSRS